MRKTADQYRHERDQLKRQLSVATGRLDKLEQEVLDYQRAMQAMQGHNAAVISQLRDTERLSPDWHRIQGWMDAMRVFTREVLNATSRD